jgi:hypothetical protein
MQQKYSKIFDTEKQQAPPCLLNRQNSSDSLNSLQSMFSQRSFQSSSTTNKTLSSTDSSGLKLGNNGGGTSNLKKRSWLRSSFSRAFSRKHNPQNSETNPNECKSKSSERQIKPCLSDVDENELNGSGLISGQRYADFDECNGHFKNIGNSFDGDYSLPNSPLHQQQNGRAYINHNM